MIAVDTSVVVAAFASWHESHQAALRALRGAPRLPAHVAHETFSVLTRLPPPHRADAEIVATFLELRFPGPLLALRGGDLKRLPREAVAAGITGGSIYDALVAATARRAGATLLTRDRRAVPVYEAMGIKFDLVS